MMNMQHNGVDDADNNVNMTVLFYKHNQEE